MEVHQKRKYSHNGEIEVKKQIKTEKNDGKSKETAVEDDEVEEFYAILRRIRVAVKYFEKRKYKDVNNNITSIISKMKSEEDRVYADITPILRGRKAEGGGVRKNLKAAQLWNPALRTEDIKRVVDGVKEKERVEDNAGLDLNADPVTDPKSESD
ncbi:hypothetical protein K7X08_030784 [Anisodus acutangulus]|uniref:Uncharacterized protein n=1 Tax=Anisodus acutangulus TaxID=402998 RepID=A0A9Q1RCC1_9SOLA|nr:hypothetical protein K7X08_030784 [Anisodus acutangulus]